MGKLDDFAEAVKNKDIGRLNATAKSETVGLGGTIAGMNVSETEEQRNAKRKKRIVNTSIRIDKELKDKAQTLAALKHVSFTQLIEMGLNNMIRKNAKLMNEFSKYEIEETEE